MPCILTQCGTAGLMISELSAGCDCRLFGTGLVMSENASDCTQNAAYRDRKFKKFMGRGHSPLPKPLPHWGGGHILPKPHPPRRLDPRRLYATSILALSALDLLPPPTFIIPPSHISGYGPDDNAVKQCDFQNSYSAIAWRKACSCAFYI